MSGAYGNSTNKEVFYGIFEFLVRSLSCFISSHFILNTANSQPILLILILWAARPLYKFIFPLGHRHGEGAHTREFTAEENNRAASLAGTHTTSPGADVKV
jgi:hypothetical protein